MNANEKKAALLSLAKQRQCESFEGYSRKYFDLCDFHDGYYERDHVVPWTVNTPCDWDAMIAAGVDGIITDDPAGLIVHLEARGLR